MSEFTLYLGTAILLAVSIMMMSFTSAETPPADVSFDASITAQQ